jgi:hypothetical protein
VELLEFFQELACGIIMLLFFTVFVHFDFILAHKDRRLGLKVSFIFFQKNRLMTAHSNK